MKKIKYYSALILFLPLLFTSCNKDTVNTAIDSSYAEADGQADDTYSEVDGITESSLSIYNLGARVEETPDSLIMCAIKSINFETKTITIDFGDGCQGFGGRVRKGKIHIHYTDRFFKPGSVVTTTFDNFYLNDVKVEGTRIRTNISDLLGAIPKFHVVLTGGKLTWPDSTFSTRESDFTQTWNRGISPYNDEIMVDGSASGITRDGKEYLMNITSTLLFKRACWRFRAFIPVSGVKEIISNGNIMTIDYGDGTCDRSATITANGVSRTIEITKGR